MKLEHKPFRGNDIRERNEKIILNLIRKSGLLSQSQVVKLTGLKPPTVLRIFSKLVKAGLIRISSVPVDLPEKKGRKPVFYELHPSAGYVIGIDFWAEHAAIVVVNFASEPIFEDVTHFPKRMTAAKLKSALINLVDGSMETIGITPDDVLGLGIGAPGKVDIAAGKITSYARIKGMTGFDLAGIFGERYGFPVYAHNNASVIALRAFEERSGEEVGSMLTVLIRSGVGGGYIQNGELLVSNSKTILEIGHMSIDANGPECDCGGRGCLESYLSESAILAGAEEFGAIDIDSLEAGLVSSTPGIEALIEDKVAKLGFALRNLQFLLGADAILIITRSETLSRVLAQGAERYFAGLSGDVPVPAKILYETYDPIQAGTGASQLFFENYFSA